MTGARDIDGPGSLIEEAASWVVRVQSEAAREDDWLALEAWLAQSPEHRAAFDEAEALWWEYGDLSAELLSALTSPRAANVVNLSARRALARPYPRWRLSLAIAASVAAALFGVWRLQPLTPTAQVYVTEVGERREIALADGSHVFLNSRSHLTATVDRHHRRVTLDSGEAVFDVAKDHAHPFVVNVGDQDVTVVGTEFDILRFGGRDIVTVNRGIVSVSPANAGNAQAVRLTPGDQLRHVEGETNSELGRVEASDVLAWRNGYLVYTNRALADIATDLSRYFSVPIQVSGSVGRLTFTGALRIDNEDTVVNALEGFLPVKAVHTSKAIVLEPR